MLSIFCREWKEIIKREISFSLKEYGKKTQDKEVENSYSDLENKSVPLADV